MRNIGCKNTDKEIWRKTEGDYYSPSIFVTQLGNIGINVGGYVLIAPVEEWHKAGLGREGRRKPRKKNTKAPPKSPSRDKEEP